jgi:hypothetical protein
MRGSFTTRGFVGYGFRAWCNTGPIALLAEIKSAAVSLSVSLSNFIDGKKAPNRRRSERFLALSIQRV